jgi:nicotinamidase-related amidase
VHNGELVVRKSDDDSFAGTSLAAELDSRAVKQVVVAGMLSDCCVAATVRGALRHGRDVVLASGAHGTYATGESAETRAAEVETDLSREGALVVPAAQIDFR